MNRQRLSKPRQAIPNQHLKSKLKSPKQSPKRTISIKKSTKQSSPVTLPKLKSNAALPTKFLSRRLFSTSETTPSSQATTLSPPATPAASNPLTIPPQDFYKLDLRVGKINVVKDHPNADVLYLLDCDLGDPETRQVVTNIKPTTPKEVLEGKNLIFLANLKPVAFRGEKTFAMIFGGSSQDDSKHELVSPLNTTFLPQWGVKYANLADISVESGADLIKPGSRLFLAGQKPVDGEVARQNDKNIPKLMSQFSTNEATGELTFAGHKVVVKGINGDEIALGLNGIPNAKFS